MRSPTLRRSLETRMLYYIKVNVTGLSTRTTQVTFLGQHLLFQVQITVYCTPAYSFPLLINNHHLLTQQVLPGPSNLLQAVPLAKSHKFLLGTLTWVQVLACSLVRQVHSVSTQGVHVQGGELKLRMKSAGSECSSLKPLIVDISHTLF